MSLRIVEVPKHPESMLDVVRAKYPEIRWFVSGLLEPGTFNILIGPGSIGKTRFVYGLAACVVSDTPVKFLGHARTFEIPGHVLYFDAETRPRQSKDRIAPYGLSDDELDRIEVVRGSFDLRTLDEIRLRILRQDTDLLVIDPWLTLQGASKATDDPNTGVAETVSKLIALAAETGVAILAVCHTTKAFSRQYHNERGETSIEMLSTSAIGASALFNLAQTRMILDSGGQAIERGFRKLFVGGKELEWRSTSIVLDKALGTYRFPKHGESEDTAAYRQEVRVELSSKPIKLVDRWPGQE
jgi:RecA-family ATPase